MRSSTLRGTFAASFQIASRSSIGSLGNQVNESNVGVAVIEEEVFDGVEVEISL